MLDDDMRKGQVNRRSKTDKTLSRLAAPLLSPQHVGPEHDLAPSIKGGQGRTVYSRAITVGLYDDSWRMPGFGASCRLGFSTADRYVGKA